MSDHKGSRQKEDLNSFKEEIIHQFHVISEDIISQVKLVAEGVANVNEKLDRNCQQIRAEIEEKTQPIAQAVSSLNVRVNGLDEKVGRVDEKVGQLDAKVDRLDEKVGQLDSKVGRLDEKVNNLDVNAGSLENKLDRFHHELKTEIQETRQEILAAVKFSYAELDRRITTLEKEFLDLKSRVDKIESRGLS